METVRVGQWVRYAVPEKERDGYHATARVDAIETYEDSHGKRTWIYVRFVDGDGKPEQNSTKCALAELEAA